MALDKVITARGLEDEMTIEFEKTNADMNTIMARAEKIVNMPYDDEE